MARSPVTSASARGHSPRLPLPRVDAERQIVVNNLASFAEAWSLETR